MTTAIEQRQANRFLFLKRLYELTDGDKFRTSGYEQVGKDVGVTEGEAMNIAQHLEGKGLIKWTNISGGIGITEYGVDEVESALTHPKEATSFFPPINVMNIGSITNSQVQQGTVGSSQSSISGSERDDIVRALAEVREIVGVLPLSPQECADVDGNAATAEAQLQTSKPNRGTIREALAVINETLKPFAEAAGVVATLGKLANLMGS